jgi:hypothetical protein
MTLVNQDLIFETALTMGAFTTKQMTFAVYGDVTASHISGTQHKLARLLKSGKMERVGRMKADGCQRQMYWRAIQ